MADGQTAAIEFIGNAVKAAVASAGPIPRTVSSQPSRSAPLDIAIPIYKSAALLARCLHSLLPTLSDADRVWLIDDASEDSEVSRLAREFEQKWPNTRRLSNPSNLGFVGTSNRAIELSNRDIVLLNSDCELTTGWLEHLQACLVRNPQAGIVCPLSNHATILSVVPETDCKSGAKMASAMSKSTLGDVPIPTAVGFCMLMRRKMIEQLGTFSNIFAPGYGEENDLSMRALKAGWDVLAADQACVFHYSGGSFPNDRSVALRTQHQALLDRIWPEYGPLVQSWWRNNPLRIRAEQLARQEENRTAVVHVLHRQYLVGGTERVARSLIDALGEEYQHTLVYPGQSRNPWCDFELRATGACRELMLNNRWIRPALRIAGHGADLTCPHSERSLARIIQGSGARIVHFHHMLHWDSLMLPAIAGDLGCRVVISVHDFWFNCPIHNQLEQSTGKPCGRRYAHSDNRCLACLRSASDTSEMNWQNMKTYNEGRYAVTQEMLLHVDAILVPSQFIRRKIIEAYPLIQSDRVKVQPHGVAVPDALPDPVAGPERILAYFGGDQILKGVELVLRMAFSLASSNVTIRIYGRTKGLDVQAMPGNVELRGFYNLDQLDEVMQGVDLALIPSFYEESFSMVASECWAHGIPVLASDRGALSERVIDSVNGWLVPDMRPESWIQCLQAILGGRAIENCREQLLKMPPTSIEQSASSLNQMYQALLSRTVSAPVNSQRRFELPRFHQKLERLRADPPLTPIDQHCLGILRDHWGTPAYRVRFPLLDLARSGGCRESHFHVIRQAGFHLRDALQESSARHIVVQPFISDEGLKMMELLHRESCHHITLVVDDLWTEMREDNPAATLMPDDIEGRLKHAASLSHSLVLTTEELRRCLDLSHQNTHIINNALPGWIWDSLQKAKDEDSTQRLRIGWSGAPQHMGDLEFLEAVMKDTADLADWVFLGMCPEHLRSLGAEFHGMVPFDQYPTKLAGLNLDLAIAPLAKHAFNRCKSHLKVLECGILGLPMVACDLEPYQDCPIPLAAADSARDWTEKLRHLLKNHEERRILGRALRHWVLDNHMTEHRRPDWQAALGIESNVD